MLQRETSKGSSSGNLAGGTFPNPNGEQTNCGSCRTRKTTSNRVPIMVLSLIFGDQNGPKHLKRPDFHDNRLRKFLAKESQTGHDMEVVAHEKLHPLHVKCLLHQMS
jgi:hypothetical protein